MGRKKNEDNFNETQLALDLTGSGAGIITAGALETLVKKWDDEIDASGKSRKKSELIDPKKQVVISNGFVVGLEEGTRFAHKISRIAIGQIPMDADTLPVTIITANDIEEMGLTRQRLTGHMNEVIDEILSYRIKIASIDTLHNKKLTGVNMFAMATVIPGKGAIAVQLNPILKEHFLGLKADFTQYSLPIVTKMPGYAASKLHELLLSRARKYDADLIRFSIADLVTILNHKPRGEFKPSTFVNNVIKRAVKSINENTECEVRIQPVRNGREFTDVRFYIESWKSIEEKQAHMKWKEEAAENPMAKEVLDAAEEDIKSRLKTGEGELYLKAQDDYNTKKKSSK